MPNQLRKPPSFAKWLLFFFLNHNHPETMLADFEEIFHDAANRKGLLWARPWYWGQVFVTIPSFVNN